MKKTLILLTCLFLSVSAALACNPEKEGQAHKNKVCQGYSGGMMLHAGYLADGSSSPFARSGFTTGIGGAVKIHLWKHLRVGSEGYVSSMKLDNDGYIESGWGGVLAEWWGHHKRFHPYAGLTLGGGSRKSLHLFEGDSTDWEKEENAVYNITPFFAVAPYIGCEFSLTGRLKLALKLDYLVALHKKEVLNPHGPRLYFGFIFGH